MTTVHANQTTCLANGRAANWAPEVVFGPFRTLSYRQLTSRPVAIQFFNLQVWVSEHAYLIPFPRCDGDVSVLSRPVAYPFFPCKRQSIRIYGYVYGVIYSYPNMETVYLKVSNISRVPGVN